MGCCCSLGRRGDDGSSNKGRESFSGQGHRLGTAGEATFGSGVPKSMRGGSDQQESLPKPVVDPHLDDGDREQIRAARAKAAEARAKKAGHKPQKKKKADPSEPLRGPNSQNMMRWTAN